MPQHIRTLPGFNQVGLSVVLLGSVVPSVTG